MEIIVIVVIGAIFIFIFLNYGSKNKPPKNQQSSNSDFEINLNFKPSDSNIPHYLVVDVETTGLPINNDAPPSEVNNFPRIIQIAWLLLDKDGGIIEQYDEILTQTANIPASAVRIHGITNERAKRDGIHPIVVFNDFIDAVKKAKFLVAHNVDFDKPIIESELIRHNLDNVLANKRTICTMKRSVEYCHFQLGTGTKWPKLSQLYQACYMPDYPHPITISDSHNALVDAFVTGKCLLKLKEHGVINQ